MLHSGDILVNETKLILFVQNLVSKRICSLLLIIRVSIEGHILYILMFFQYPIHSRYFAVKVGINALQVVVLILGVYITIFKTL